MKTQTSVQALICRLSNDQCRSLLSKAGISPNSNEPVILRGMVREQYQDCRISAIDVRESVDRANQL